VANKTAESRAGDQPGTRDSTPAGDQTGSGHSAATGGESDIGEAAPAVNRPPTEDEPASTDAPGVESGESAGATGRLRRWLLAVLAGAGTGLPIGWLLCYGGLLPFFLGLFYFLLLGLIVGAVAYRVGLPARPLPKIWLVVGAAVVVLFTWGISILVEAYDFPDQVADVAVRQPRKLPAGMTPEQYRRQSAQEVSAYMRERHPPGGVIGYVHWALTSSRIDPPAGKLRQPFKANQPRAWWAARVILCFMFLFYGVYSQVGPLSRLSTGRDRTGSGVNPLSKI